ncbi:hypothetical protein DNHGIG_23730 [Collibacillus ludicampi]|uniref:Uncharacterized protein n=1 Tax=Collibacillus ludicampi TaxID=2771369 RepID=A0AAV4LH49_9BACL|nr:hypothetical protein [Collibacillus ludicampi]GIM46824.1 hypothetical protein DNHGIG_23730 [Collibacillus ludicampi]
MNIHYNDELIQPIGQVDPQLRNDTRLLHYAELAELFVQTFEVYYELAADSNVPDTHVQNTKKLVHFVGNMLSSISFDHI